MARRRFHPFLPLAAEKPSVLRWLRRIHAYLGLTIGAGAILFAVTAITLAHDNFGIENEIEREQDQISVPENLHIDSAAGLADLVKRELGLQTRFREGAGMGMGMGMGGANTLVVSFVAPSGGVTASYVRGASHIEIDRETRGFLNTINRMHQGTAIPTSWKVMGDVVAWAIVLLSITGLLMWSGTHGRRLLAVGLLGSTLVVSVFYFTVGA